jgi:hypothetical protein
MKSGDCCTVRLSHGVTQHNTRGLGVLGIDLRHKALNLSRSHDGEPRCQAFARHPPSAYSIATTYSREARSCAVGVHPPAGSHTYAAGSCAECAHTAGTNLFHCACNLLHCATTLLLSHFLHLQPSICNVPKTVTSRSTYLQPSICNVPKTVTSRST